jgi:uncharacterized phage infection (PIP) family protein YhgE
MALQPPFDQAVKPIINLFSKFSDKLNGLQDKLSDTVNQMQSKVNDLPDNVQCDDSRIQELKDLFDSLNDTISKIQDIFETAQQIVNILIIVATISAIVIALLSLSPIPLPIGTPPPVFNKALEVSSYVVATILGVLGLVSLGLNVVVEKISSIAEQIQPVLQKVSNTCSNESFNLNSIKRSDSADEFSDMNVSEFNDMFASKFYQSVNVSDSDLQDRGEKIEQLLEQQRSLIDNLIEAPSNVLSDIGAPQSNLGKKGDYYINIDTNKIFGPKPTDTTWNGPLN